MEARPRGINPTASNADAADIQAGLKGAPRSSGSGVKSVLKDRCAPLRAIFKENQNGVVRADLALAENSCWPGYNQACPVLPTARLASAVSGSVRQGR